MFLHEKINHNLRQTVPLVAAAVAALAAAARSAAAALAASAVAAALHRIGRKHQCGIVSLHLFLESLLPLSRLSLNIPSSRASAHSLQS